MPEPAYDYRELRYMTARLKSSKMLCFFPVTEAYGFIYSRPSGKNSSFVDETVEFHTKV